MTMERHFATLWEAMADVLGDQTAIAHGPTRMSWSELDDHAARLASAMTAHGVGLGDRVAVHLRNVPEFLVVWFAALKVRAVPTNFHPRYGEEELAYLVRDASPCVIVTQGDLAPTLLAAVEDGGARPWILVVDDAAAGLPVLADVIAHAEPAPRVRRSADDSTLLYTGGTTGLPKGVVVDIGTKVDSDVGGASSHLGERTLDLERVVELAVSAAAEDRRFVSVVPCPMTHGTGLTIGATTALSVGGVVVLTPQGFDARAVWQAVRDHRAYAMVIVGDAMGRPLLAALDDDHPTSLRLLASSGAVLSPDVKAGLLAGMAEGASILDLLASSEMALGWSIATRGPEGVTEGFHLVPGVALVDGDRILEPGDVGIGVLASRTPPVGYHGDPDALAALRVTIDDVDWYRSGDRATWRPDGMMELLGRASSIVNTGGEKVDTGEVERVILAMQDVHDVIVVGVPDARLGQAVGAVIASSGGVTSADVQRAVRDRLSDYKIPRVIRFVDRVPRHDTGKPDYPSARAVLGQP